MHSDSSLDLNESCVLCSNRAHILCACFGPCSNVPIKICFLISPPSLYSSISPLWSNKIFFHLQQFLLSPASMKAWWQMEFMIHGNKSTSPCAIRKCAQKIFKRNLGRTKPWEVSSKEQREWQLTRRNNVLALVIFFKNEFTKSNPYTSALSKN